MKSIGKPMSSRKAGMKSISGFTLIEILVTIVILAVGLLGFTMMHTSSISSALLTRNVDSCANLASDAFDRVKANVGSADYGTDFTVTVDSACAYVPTGATDADYLCNAMHNMHLTNATMDVSFQYDAPLVGVDTVTTDIAMSGGANPTTCQFVNLILLPTP